MNAKSQQLDLGQPSPFSAHLAAASVPVLASLQTGAPQDTAKRSSLKARCAIMRVFGRIFGLASLAVPFTYLFVVLIGAGVLRPELVGQLRLSTWAAMLVEPVEWLGQRIFAVPTSYRGVDMLLVGTGVLAVILRSMMMSLIHRLGHPAGEAVRKPSRPPLALRIAPAPPFNAARTLDNSRHRLAN